jgi:hypothetical protein
MVKIRVTTAMSKMRVARTIMLKPEDVDSHPVKQDRRQTGRG